MIAYDAKEWRAWEGGAFDFAALDVVDFSDEDPRGIDGVWVSGRPALSEEALVTGVGWGGYAFWVPPRQELACAHGFSPWRKVSRTPTIGSSQAQTSFCVTSAGSTDH